MGQLYVSGGLARMHLASFDPHDGPPVHQGQSDFFLFFFFNESQLLTFSHLKF